MPWKEPDPEYCTCGTEIIWHLGERQCLRCRVRYADDFRGLSEETATRQQLAPRRLDRAEYVRLKNSGGLDAVSR